MTKTRHTKRSTKSTTARHRYCCEVTFDGLEKWYTTKFEKLGWMVLAKSRGNMEKILAYSHSVKCLEREIEHKMTHIHEKDRKEDLEVMLKNVRILQEHISKDFM